LAGKMPAVQVSLADGRALRSADPRLQQSHARRLARRLKAAPKRIAAIFALPNGAERVFTPGQIEPIDAVALPAKRRLDSG
jgi:hypothetical protein